MSTNEFNPYPFEGLMKVPSGPELDKRRKRPGAPRTNRLVDSIPIPRIDADPKAMKRELRKMTKGELGPVSRLLTSAGVMNRTLNVLDEREPTYGDGGVEYARNTNKVTKALVGGVATISLGAGASLGLGIASDKLNEPEDNLPNPQMLYDGTELINNGMQPLHNEPSRATIPITGEEHA